MFWDLLSSLDEDDLTYNPTWKHYPFMQQKIVGVRIEITSTFLTKDTISYTAAVAGYVDHPTQGLELAKIEKDRKTRKY